MSRKKDEDPDLSDWPKTRRASDPTPDEQGKNQEAPGGKWSEIMSEENEQK